MDGDDGAVKKFSNPIGRFVIMGKNWPRGYLAW